MPPSGKDSQELYRLLLRQGWRRVEDEWTDAREVADPRRAEAMPPVDVVLWDERHDLAAERLRADSNAAAADAP